MKRRGIAAHTGLGSSRKDFINGKSTGDPRMDLLINEFSRNVYVSFFKGTKLDHGYVDAGKEEYQIRVGIEPTYMYEYLKMIVIDVQKEMSYVVIGYAYGPYGTGIAENRRFYQDYKRKSKFIRLIDKWHPILFNKTGV